MEKKSVFVSEGQWYKGNIHLHTTISDGMLTPEGAVRMYRDAGYSFIAVTDHNIYGLHSSLQTDDFIIFGGIELDVSLNHDLGFCHHAVFIALPEETPFEHEQDLFEITGDMSFQEIIDYMRNNNHIAVYAHPRWSHINMEEYENVRGFKRRECFI